MLKLGSHLCFGACLGDARAVLVTFELLAVLLEDRLLELRVGVLHATAQRCGKKCKQLVSLIAGSQGGSVKDILGQVWHPEVIAGASKTLLLCSGS